ncbi:MAG: thiamine phosphate synthase, partial [Porcipelethomonas sp.]
ESSLYLMITSMCRILCVTNRGLSSGDFLRRIKEIAQCGPQGIILREKDLPAEKYTELARAVMDICRCYDVPCILHSFTQSAAAVKCSNIHLPMHVLCSLTEEERAEFKILGSSVHSTEEAKQAESMGCSYITAGHIFATDCKKGVPPRGIEFLEDVVKSVSIPVYAIGGINSENIKQVTDTGAGVCIMSGLMQCDNVGEYFEKLRSRI